MIIVRVAKAADIAALLALAHKAGPGMTTLKPDEAALAARLARVEKTLAGTAPLSQRGYLFVMEDTAAGQVVGTCGLEVAVGLEQPFYTYRAGIMVHASRELSVWNKMPTLYLSNDLTGYSELCSLFLDPHYRANKNGSLLSKSRFMFLAQFPERVGEHICAEMRGRFDDDGRSPFWESLGKHFFQIPFEQADYLVSLGKKAFVAELMPKYPVYVDFLAPEAQACIGQVHKDTAPARAMLEQEGLRFEHHVDIFDGGPVLEAYVSDLRASRSSHFCHVRIDAAAGPAGRHYLVCNTSPEDFRVALVLGEPEGGTIRLTPQAADALRVGVDDTIRALTLSPEH